MSALETKTHRMIENDRKGHFAENYVMSYTILKWCIPGLQDFRSSDKVVRQSHISMTAPACEEAKTFANWSPVGTRIYERFSDRFWPFLLSGAASHGFSFCHEMKENTWLSLDSNMENKIWNRKKQRLVEAGLATGIIWHPRSLKSLASSICCFIAPALVVSN